MSEKYYFVYILLCADKSYYTGITNNVTRRFEEHSSGTDQKAYTYKREPLILVYQERFNNPTAAIAFEKQIKGWSRKKKEALIAGNWDELRKLAQCQNETNSNNTVTNDNILKIKT